MTAPTTRPNTVSRKETPPASESSSPDVASIANLTASLRADYVALQNDLEQTQELAADFQRQLAGKSNEVAHFKSLLEKTQMDLGRMESHVAELRAERHRLANKVMTLVEKKELVAELQAERDQFRREVEALRSALTSSGGEYEERIRLQEMEITRLRAALDGFRKIPGNSQRAPGGVAAGVNDRIAELSATVERLEAIIRDRPAARDPGAKPAEPKPEPEPEKFIDISFGT
jgi:chromosome segregation ATPase